jgi:hypothetical protein
LSIEQDRHNGDACAEVKVISPLAAFLNVAVSPFPGGPPAVQLMLVEQVEFVVPVHIALAANAEGAAKSAVRSVLQFSVNVKFWNGSNVDGRWLAEICGAGLFFGQQLVQRCLLNLATSIVTPIVGCEDGGVHRQGGGRDRVRDDLDV